MGGTSIPSTSAIGSSHPSFSFDFLGACLLGDPLEAMASVLPDGLFEDIERTTPFKFAQDIVESQIAVFLFNPYINTRFLFLFSFLIHFLCFRILSDLLLRGPTFWNTCVPIPTLKLLSTPKSVNLNIPWCPNTKSLPD